MSLSNRIYMSSPHMGGNEIKFIKAAFDQNWIAPLGPNVDAFEQELSAAVGVKHVAALVSGTSAIHLSLILLNVKPDDYVIGSTLTFSASINPIVYQGAIPVLIDSETDTWNMDPELLALAIERSDKKPRAIIVTHLYGMPSKINEIIAIANKYDIPVIEDAAEALGSEYYGKRVGCFGKFGILSFNGNKIITTSGGGALLSDDESLIKRARYLATQARDPAPHYQHSAIGYNYRMSNVVAGIGRGQLEVLNSRIRQRRAINKWYREMLGDIPGISFQNEPSRDFFSNFWLTCIVINPDKAGTNREEISLALEDANIEARPIWKPMHLQPVFAKAGKLVNGNSERLFNQGLCLPSGSNMSEEDRSRISKVLLKCFKKDSYYLKKVHSRQFKNSEKDRG